MKYVANLRFPGHTSPMTVSPSARGRAISGLGYTVGSRGCDGRNFGDPAPGSADNAAEPSCHRSSPGRRQGATVQVLG